MAPFIRLQNVTKSFADINAVNNLDRAVADAQV